MIWSGERVEYGEPVELPPVKLITWRSIKKPTGLRGFAIVSVAGCRLPEMPVMIGRDYDRYWIGSGRGHRGIAWENEELQAAFSEAVVALVCGKYGASAMSGELDQAIETPEVGQSVNFDHPTMGILSGVIRQVGVPRKYLNMPKPPVCPACQHELPDQRTEDEIEAVMLAVETVVDPRPELIKVTVKDIPAEYRRTKQRTFDVWQRNLRPGAHHVSTKPMLRVVN